MATNPNVLIDREKYLGGSEISTIMGINKFNKRYDLLLYKAGIKEANPITNEYIEYGNVMEGKIRDYINKDLKDKYIEDTVIKEEDIISLRCNYDGKNKTSALEIKTTSQIHDNVIDYNYYLVQLLYGMMLADLKTGILAVYERPEDFNEEFDSTRLQIFDINIDDYGDLCEEIKNAINSFKIDLQKIKANPLLSEEDLLPMTVQDLSREIEIIEKQMADYKELEKRQKELKTKLYDAMVNNDIKGWETPNGTLITRVSAKPDTIENVFNEELFKKKNPIIWANYCEEKVKKGKSGYVLITLRKDKKEDE